MNFLSSIELIVALIHTPMNPLSLYMTTWILPRPHPSSPRSLNTLPPIHHNWLHTLPWLNSQLYPMLHISSTPHLIPCQWYCSFLGHTIPPTTHHVYHHFFPHKSIFWCLWTYWPPCRRLLEMRTTFSTNQATSANASVQPKDCIRYQNHPNQPHCPLPSH